MEDYSVSENGPGMFTSFDNGRGSGKHRASDYAEDSEDDEVLRGGARRIPEYPDAHPLLEQLIQSCTQVEANVRGLDEYILSLPPDHPRKDFFERALYRICVDTDMLYEMLNEPENRQDEQLLQEKLAWVNQTLVQLAFLLRQVMAALVEE